MNTYFFVTLFFGMNWCKQRDETKLKYTVLKKFLFKAIIVLTGIYFESYCKIPARFIYMLRAF